MSIRPFTTREKAEIENNLVNLLDGDGGEYKRYMLFSHIKQSYHPMDREAAISFFQSIESSAGLLERFKRELDKVSVGDYFFLGDCTVVRMLNQTSKG